VKTHGKPVNQRDRGVFMQVGAYRVTADGSFVADYTPAHERELGLTPRHNVGSKWVDVQDTALAKTDLLSTEPYKRGVQRRLGVKSQQSLADLMEDEWSLDGHLHKGSVGYQNNNNPSSDNAVRVLEGE
jgi:hypothetical protein